MVHGVDISGTGIAQMFEDAEHEGLDVTGVVADIVAYQPQRDYDVVVLDRVLHMLNDDRARLAVLEKAGAVTRSGGFVLIADTPRSQPLIRSFFQDRADEWVKTRDKKGFIFARRASLKSDETLGHSDR